MSLKNVSPHDPLAYMCMTSELLAIEPNILQQGDKPCCLFSPAELNKVETKESLTWCSVDFVKEIVPPSWSLQLLLPIQLVGTQKCECQEIKASDIWGSALYQVERHALYTHSHARYTHRHAWYTHRHAQYTYRHTRYTHSCGWTFTSLSV